MERSRIVRQRTQRERFECQGPVGDPAGAGRVPAAGTPRADAAGMIRYTPALALVLAFAPACGGADTEAEAYQRAEIQAAQQPQFDWWSFFEGVFADIWESVCLQWDVIRDVGVRAFCDAYLDNMGVPETGLKRTIGRTICMRKVNAAIDEAVCAIVEAVTPEAVEPEAPGGP